MNSQGKYHANSVFRKLREALLPFYGKESDMLSYILLETYLNIDRKDCIAGREVRIEDQMFSILDEAVEKLKKYEPVQYITGKTHFFGRELKIRPGVLIPRQETEELIQLIKTKNDKKHPLILDIGSGSGCIAVTLALEIVDSTVYAVDKYRAGVELTRENSRGLGAGVIVNQLDIFSENLSFSEFDIIVSNPPYVTESEKVYMKPNVMNYEPHEALYVPDENPTLFYQRILEIAETALKPGGLLFFEINEAFGSEINFLLNARGFREVEVYKDIHGKDRFAYGRKPDES
jgi:release factor glutamine methyltransferase